MQLEKIKEEYLEKTDKDLPIWDYAKVMTMFTGIVATGLVIAWKRHKLPRDVTLREVVLLGLATHKLARIVTRDKVTIPLRAAFTRFQRSAGAGEVDETPRGQGTQRAIGDLLNCPFCLAPWVAATLTLGYLANRRVTRVVAGIFATVAVSDFLQRLYARAKA